MRKRHLILDNHRLFYEQITQKIWSDPVWSKVISAIIIVAVSSLVGIAQYYNWWNKFYDISGNFLSNKIPIWLILSLLLLVFVTVYLIHRFTKSPNELNEYFTIPEAAKKLGILESTLYKWGADGKYILSVLNYEPKEYEDTRTEQDALGNKVEVVRTQQTIFSFQADDFQPLKIGYLNTEDALSIILNDVPDRKIIVRKLYPDAQLKKRNGSRKK